MREHAAHLLGRLTAALGDGFICLGGVGHALMVPVKDEANSIRSPGQRLGQHEMVTSVEVEDPRELAELTMPPEDLSPLLAWLQGHAAGGG